MKRTVLTAVCSALLTTTGLASAEPVRILVAAGSTLGLGAERPLKFATNDASRVRDVMVGLGGVKPEDAQVLREPTRGQLFSAIEKARAQAQKHRAEEVTLVFYFSGHGDREALHLGEDRLPLTELSAKLGEVPAELRISVTDACRATREKGFSAEAPFAISATMVPQATGQVWLHASSDGEAAQESDELQGAIFTHAWLNGLRGAADANGDARVTLDESFAFAHSQTMIRSAKSSGVLQKPEAVVTLREAAPVVLTQTGTRLATLSLPQAKDAHFLVYSAGAKSVLSELWSSPERRIAMRIPAGRYVIQRRAGAIGSKALVAIAEGEERKIEDRDFMAGSSLEALARKGEEADAAPAPVPASAKHHELALGYVAGASFRMGFVHGPQAGYAYATKHVAVTLGGGLELSSREVTGASERLTSGYGRAGVEGRLPVGRITLRAGAGARAGVVAQSVAPTNDGSRTVTAADNGAFAMGPDVLAAVRLAVDSSRTWFTELSATGSALFLKEEGETRGITGAVAGASIGSAF